MPKKRKELTLIEPVEPLIREIRGERVMLDSDLARIYGVPTKVLNQSVKRNADRFPPDFLFRLSEEELETVIRSQTVTASKRNVRFLPYAFTEHGAIMAANVLSSRRAVEMSIHVIRAFVTLRRESGRYAELARKLAALERNQQLHGEDIQMILSALRQLEETSSWAYPEGRRLIGFHSKEIKDSGTKGNPTMNANETEPLVALRCFGPDVNPVTPEMARIGRTSSQVAHCDLSPTWRIGGVESGICWGFRR
jgi:hypothetical protein